MQAVTAYIPPGTTAIDVGCNIGAFTTFFTHKVGETGHVHSFDIQSWVFGCLEKTLQKNNHVNIVTTHVCGASNKVGEMPMVSNCTGGSFVNATPDLHPVPDWQGERVQSTSPVKPIDDFKIQNVSVIKVDAEGHDVEVVEGALQTIKQNRPVLILESSAENHEATIKLLDGLNYSWDAYPGCNFVWIPNK